MRFISSSRVFVLPVVVAGVSVLLGACSSGPGRASAEPQYEEGSIVHQVSSADRQQTQRTEPLAGDRAVLWVNGLGCPQCASNVDIQLLRLKGVEEAKVDLSTGKVTIAMAGPSRPSPAQLTHAVEDAGFTLAKIEVQ